MSAALLAGTALAATFAAADRFAGGGLGASTLKTSWGLPGRSLAYAGVGVVAVGAAVGSWQGISLGLGWLAYRSLGFPHNALTPTTWRETAVALGRHAVALPVALVAWGSAAFGAAALAAGLYVLAAVALALWFGHRNAAAKADARPIDPRDNATVELLRGAAFGVAAAFTLLT